MLFFVSERNSFLTIAKIPTIIIPYITTLTAKPWLPPNPIAIPITTKNTAKRINGNHHSITSFRYCVAVSIDLWNFWDVLLSAMKDTKTTMIRKIVNSLNPPNTQTNTGKIITAPIIVPSTLQNFPLNLFLLDPLFPFMYITLLLPVYFVRFQISGRGEYLLLSVINISACLNSSFPFFIYCQSNLYLYITILSLILSIARFSCPRPALGKIFILIHLVNSKIFPQNFRDSDAAVFLLAECLTPRNLND